MFFFSLILCTTKNTFHTIQNALLCSLIYEIKIKDKNSLQAFYNYYILLPLLKRMYVPVTSDYSLAIRQLYTSCISTMTRNVSVNLLPSTWTTSIIMFMFSSCNNNFVYATYQQFFVFVIFININFINVCTNFYI